MARIWKHSTGKAPTINRNRESGHFKGKFFNLILPTMFKEISREKGFALPYVFTWGGNKIKNASGAFNAACRRAGIANFRFHDLRHTFTFQLVIRGASLEEVHELRGRRTMTLRDAHLASERKKIAVILLCGFGNLYQKRHVTN
jgi:integrase